MTVYGSFPYFSDESIEEVTNEIRSILKSGRLTDGPQALKFEKEFARYNNIKYAVATNSGTASLDIALRYFRLDNREVIVPTNTFISTPNAVLFAGGKPIFADMNAETLGINLDDVKGKITSKTAGVVVVHIAGLICPQIKELKELCQEKGLFLIEDCAHAHGATLDNKKAGTFGDAGCFSFYPTKVMTSCEGGMIITSNKELVEEAQMIRSCGQNLKREAVMLGHNWRMNEVVAAIGRSQLAHLDEFLEKRNKIAGWYSEALAGIKGVSPLMVPSNSRCSYYKFPIFLSYGVDRLRVAAEMKEKHNIETGHVYYPPCHMHPIYLNPDGSKKWELPISENVLKQVMCLPMHYMIEKETVDHIKESLASSINAR